jgi:hypothetical protein
MISIFEDVELQVVDVAIQDSELASDVLGTDSGEERAAHCSWDVQQDDDEERPRRNWCVSEDEVHVLRCMRWNRKRQLDFESSQGSRAPYIRRPRYGFCR